MEMVRSYPGFMEGVVKELLVVLKDDDMWIKEEGGRNDVLDEDKYQKAFPRSSKRNHTSWTTESSRAVVFIPENHLDLAEMITSYPWCFLFPNMVARDKTVKFYTDDDDSPHMSTQVVLKQLHAATPMIASRNLAALRTCLQIGPGTWVVAEISLADGTNPCFFHRLPSGCLIERITDHQSKVTWVEHTEVDRSLPELTSAFAFGAQRMASWLERFCEKTSVTEAAQTLIYKTIDVPGNQEKLMLMDFGAMMVRGLFQNITPIGDYKPALLTSFTDDGPDDLEVHACVYKSCDGSEVAGAVVAFPVKHSPDFVLETLADHLEWDVLLRGCTRSTNSRKYSTGDHPMNTISVSEISGSGNEMLLIKEVDVNPSGSLVVWSTVSKESFDRICNVNGVPEDSMLTSGFSISADHGHTTTSNTSGSVITLVLRMLVDQGNQSLEERGQQAMKSITEAINQTVEGVKEALEPCAREYVHSYHQQRRLTLMEFGEMMVRGLFQNISPIENNESTLLRSVTGPEDLKVHASVYESFAKSEVAGAMVAFPVKHSPDFVLKTLSEGRKHHEWDVLRGCSRFKKLGQVSTGGDPRNNISYSSLLQFDRPIKELLIRQVDVNPSGSLVVWSTVSKESFDLMRKGYGVLQDSMLISGFSISADHGHTTTSNTSGSVITLVLRTLVEEGNQSLQERRQQAMESIALAINETVSRVKVVLDKQRPPRAAAAERRLTDDQTESCKKPRIAAA